MRAKNLGFRQTGTVSLTGRVDNPRQNELSSSRGLHPSPSYSNNRTIALEWLAAKSIVYKELNHKLTISAGIFPLLTAGIFPLLSIGPVHFRLLGYFSLTH